MISPTVLIATSLPEAGLRVLVCLIFHLPNALPGVRSVIARAFR